MLLFHAKDNHHARYSGYLAEILRLEGFADFDETALDRLNAETLAGCDLAILPRVALTAGQAELLHAYVLQGGKLLALLPDSHFIQRFGLTPTWRAADAGWLHPAGDLAAAVCPHPVQIVVATAGWAVADGADAQVLAEHRPGKERDGAAAAPAVVASRVGAGEAIFFAYDLAHAVARLRQGNPDHADLCYAGLDGIVRPSELFVGQLDVGQMLIPQADVHTALLARAVERLAPRPRLWYYPQPSQRSALIMTSDDDWSTVAQFEALLAGLAQRRATCTFYIVPETKINGDLMRRWEEAGHTFSVHPALAGDIHRGLAVEQPQSTQVATMLRENVGRHQAEFGRPVRTIRQHAVRWLGDVEAARVLAKLGVRMETNFVSVHPFPLGYMAGSGRALRFVATDGALIDCYQQPTMWTEEVLIHPRFVFSFKWSVERALQEVDAMLAQATGQFYTPVTINSHPVSFATYSSPLIEGTWDRALAAGMPIWSADRWLGWTEARNSIRLQAVGQGYALRTAQAVGQVTLLYPPGARLPADAATAQPIRLWGEEYHALTIHDLAAGAVRQVG